MKVFCGKCQRVQQATQKVIDASEDKTNVHRKIVVTCDVCGTELARVTNTRPRRQALGHALGRRV